MATEDAQQPTGQPAAVPPPPPVPLPPPPVPPKPQDRREWTQAAPQRQPPRRVRGGIKLVTDDTALRIDRRSGPWLTLARGLHDRETFDRGREFAALGQALAIRATTGRIEVDVQGSRRRADKVTMILQAWNEEQWRSAIDLISRDAAHSAAVLTGVLSEATLGLLERAGLRLTPATPDDVKITTTGPVGDATTLAACALLILAQRVLTSPTELLTARGLSLEAIQERIRQHRVIQSMGQAAAHTEPRIEGAASTPPPLEDCLDSFWAAPILPHEEATPAARGPHVSHALLRRLGPSPMDGKFPIVGLLASVYDEVAADVRRRIERLEAEDTGLPTDESDPTSSGHVGAG